MVNSFRGSFVGVFKSKVVHLTTLLTLDSLGVLFVNLVIFFELRTLKRSIMC